MNNKYFYFYTAWLDSSGILSASKINNLNISPEELYNMKISEMLQRRIVNEEQASRIAFEKDNEYKIQKCYDELEQRDIKFITCTEVHHPGAFPYKINISGHLVYFSAFLEILFPYRL